MRKLCVVILFILVAGVSFANVIAVDISVNTSGAQPQISYRLNEAATSVNIEIFGPLPATTHVRNLAGTTNKGLNTVGWNRADDGGSSTDSAKTYGFKIIPSDSVGHSSWETISDHATNKNFWFESPRGMSVNKNNGSPYFGMVYVNNTRTDPVTIPGSRTVGDGIYALYPDGSDPLVIGDTAQTGGVDWTQTVNSPYHTFVGPDDSLWIADWSDEHSGVWRAPADLSGSWTEILDNTGRDTAGLVAGIHGSISACYVEGTDASTVLYVQDEDYPDAQGGTTTQLSSILKFEIGNGPFPWTGAPTYQIEDTWNVAPPGSPEWGILMNSAAGAIRRDSSGKWYIPDYRSAGTDTGSLEVFSSDGSTLEWDSLADGGVSPDPLRLNVGGLALDEARNRVITCSNVPPGFIVTPLPLPTSSLDTAVTQVVWTGATSVRAIAVDLAGNVYVTSNMTEQLSIWSPPDGANSYTTETNLTLPGGEAPQGASSSWSLYK